MPRPRMAALIQKAAEGATEGMRQERPLPNQIVNASDRHAAATEANAIVAPIHPKGHARHPTDAGGGRPLLFRGDARRPGAATAGARWQAAHRPNGREGGQRSRTSRSPTALSHQPLECERDHSGCRHSVIPTTVRMSQGSRVNRRDERKTSLREGCTISRCGARVGAQASRRSESFATRV